MTDEKLYQVIHSALVARRNCNDSGNYAWRNKWDDVLDWAESQLPSGSGVDRGSKIERDSIDRIRISADFHHMDENGFYNGWTEHEVIVSPAFTGIDIRVTGRNRNGIKDYLSDVFLNALCSEVDRANIDKFLR